MNPNQFALKVGVSVLYFDTDGEVWDAAQQAGTWSTNNDNAIVFTPQSGVAKTIPVTWSFDDDNYLWLAQDGTPVHQFGGTEGPIAKFTLKGNALVVDPDINDNNNFVFTLNCKWGLLNDGRLRVAIGSTVSQIDGYLESADSGFTYKFVQLDNGAIPKLWVLKFSGAWERIDDDKNLFLHFKLDDPSKEITSSPLLLPAAVGTDPKRNHLVFRFSKNGQNHLIEFQGSVQIQKDWTLSFTIKKSQDGNVSKSLISVQTNFAFDADSNGNLVFYVGQQKAAGQQSLAIGGALTLKLGTTGLNINFAYSKQTGGGQPVQLSLAVGGQFSWANGQNQLNFQYTRNGNVQTLDVTAKVVLGSANVSGGIRITNDPSGRKVTAFLQINF